MHALLNFRSYPQRPSELQEQVVAAREQIYATVRREPLGKAYQRNFKLPESSDPRGHVYGKSCNQGGTGTEDPSRGIPAKSSLYPTTDASDEQFREQCVQPKSML